MSGGGSAERVTDLPQGTDRENRDARGVGQALFGDEQAGLRIRSEQQHGVGDIGNSVQRTEFGEIRDVRGPPAVTEGDESGKAGRIQRRPNLYEALTKLLGGNPVPGGFD